MISNDPSHYESADKWLAALRQDESWLNLFRKLLKSNQTDIKIHQEVALRRIGKGDTFEYWELYDHRTDPVVKEMWKSGLTLSNLKIRTIGMLTMEWLEQHVEMCKPNSKNINLPKELDTEKARVAFAKAIEKQYMETADGGKYRWIGAGGKGVKSQLAYFLGKIYNYKKTSSGNVGNNFPEESLNKMFGTNRLYTLLSQVYDAQKPQLWRSLIDDLFE